MRPRGEGFVAEGYACSTPLAGPFVVCGASSRHSEAESSVVDGAHNGARVVRWQVVEDREALGRSSGEDRDGKMLVGGGLQSRARSLCHRRIGGEIEAEVDALTGPCEACQGGGWVCLSVEVVGACVGPDT